MHLQDPAHWHYLVNRYFNNTISREELDELLSMAQSGLYDDALSNALLQQWEATRDAQPNSSIDWDSKLEAMLQQHRDEATVIPVTRRKKWWLPAAAAAVLLLAAGAGIYYSTRPAENAMAGNTIMVMEADTVILKPGTHGAVLTLADGRTIELDSAGNGLLATQGNTQVTSKNGTIRYNNGNNKTSDIIFNTLSTPRGKQFKLQLSDGTTVWLNAASSIRFPAVFVGDKRIVQVTGEAYFEVAHIDQPQQGSNGTALPFVVQFTHPNGSQGQVEVLGTHFNINAYADEAAVRTTLLEGKVKVTMKDQSTLLAPGQQACLNKQGHLQKNDHVDMDAVMAWKNGYFSFNETDMATLMRQIARWYDVDIEYAGDIPNRKFGGEISRNSNANDILKIMEASAVKCTITGRKIIVAP